MKRIVVGLAGLWFLAACTDIGSGRPPITGPSQSISESRTGGNPDLFFGTPLASNPSPGDANFDVGAAHDLLVPYVRVCETDGASTAAGCVVDVTEQVTGSATGLAMSFSTGSEMYSANWHTRQLQVGKNYRIEIWGAAFSTPEQKAELDARWLFGWRDISNAPSVSNCSGLEPFCLVKYGQTLPVKVRLEQFIFCPVTRNCAVQFVANGKDANLEAQLNESTGAPNAQLFIPGQNGTDFALAFEPCSNEENIAVSEAIDLPTFGPCLKALATVAGSLAEPATLSLCEDLDASLFGLSHEQQDQLSLHHFASDLSKVEALPEGWRCGDPTSGGVAQHNAPGGLRGFLYATRERLRSLIAPRTLIAAARIHRGGGGDIDFFGEEDEEPPPPEETSFAAAQAVVTLLDGGPGISFFKLALPAKFEYEFATDVLQSGLAGASHPLRVKVTDLLGDPVQNARVRWTAIAPPTDGATVLGSVPAGVTFSNAAGIAQKTVALSASGGLNVFHAFGRGIADSRASGCTIPADTPAGCNGPRSIFDPFIALSVPEFDASGVEETVKIAEGTRQLFTVFTCEPGRGTAVVDGTFTNGEWACALAYPFTAKVGGGSTPATLHVMNDGSNLYLAVRLQRSSADKVNTLQFNFDNDNSWSLNHSGASQAGDDVLSLDGKTGFADAFLTAQCANSSQSSCWATDVSGGGTNDGSGALSNDGVFTTYEVRHPLNTTDNTHDFSLSALSKVGVFLTMQTGNGAAGNTQWPGFRQYLEITIRP